MRQPRTRNRARSGACLDALRAFHARHGRAPTAGECGSGGVGRRARDRRLPHYSTLVWHFGSFRRALLEAGIVPRQHGERVRAAVRGRPWTMDPRWPAIMRELSRELLNARPDYRSPNAA